MNLYLNGTPTILYSFQILNWIEQALDKKKPRFFFRIQCMFLGVLEANQRQYYAGYHDIWVRYCPITQVLTVFAKKHTHKTTNPTLTVLNEGAGGAFTMEKWLTAKNIHFLKLKLYKANMSNLFFISIHMIAILSEVTLNLHLYL